ncbi:MAG: hypothetical protein U1E85_00265 [Rhodocyclaceae bacterium]
MPSKTRSKLRRDGSIPNAPLKAGVLIKENYSKAIAYKLYAYVAVRLYDNGRVRYNRRVSNGRQHSGGEVRFICEILDANRVPVHLYRRPDFTKCAPTKWWRGVLESGSRGAKTYQNINDFYMKPADLLRGPFKERIRIEGEAWVIGGVSRHVAGRIPRDCIAALTTGDAESVAKVVEERKTYRES